MAIPPSETSAEPATVDRMLSALSTDSRRSVLRYFEESDSRTASLDELAESVATRQSASDAGARDEIRIRLHHVGLPKLDDAGLIDYDARTTTVRYSEPGPVEELGALVAEERE